MTGLPSSGMCVRDGPPLSASSSSFRSATTVSVVVAGDGCDIDPAAATIHRRVEVYGRLDDFERGSLEPGEQPSGIPHEGPVTGDVGPSADLNLRGPEAARPDPGGDAAAVLAGDVIRDPATHDPQLHLRAAPPDSSDGPARELGLERRHIRSVLVDATAEAPVRN
jgi:hypothetical protein